MKILLIAIGKTDQNDIQNLYTTYLNRVQHYIKTEFIIIPDIKNVKNLSEDQQKEKEGSSILKMIDKSDFLVLFDEKGREMTSDEYAQFFQKKMNAGLKQLVMVIGGAYGFSPEVYERANAKVALSKMTFSHQMVRIFAIEQIYRAMTILKNEPYHHR